MGSKRQKTNQRIKNRKGEGEFQGWEACKVSQWVSLQVSGVDCDEGSGRLSAVSFAARSPKRSHTLQSNVLSDGVDGADDRPRLHKRKKERNTLKHWKRNSSTTTHSLRSKSSSSRSLYTASTSLDAKTRTEKTETESEESVCFGCVFCRATRAHTRANRKGENGEKKK